MAADVEVQPTPEEQLILDVQETIIGLLKAAAHREMSERILFSWPASISRAALEPRPTVVELGAFHAEDSAWMTPHTARYIAVEPDPRNAESIRKCGFNGITDFLEVAIAAHTGQTSLHLCDNDQGWGTASSSIRKPKKHLEYFPWCTFPMVMNVQCFTLDDLYRKFGLIYYPYVELLWVDVQGAERDVIAGGADALRRTHYMMIEADDQEMYEGQANRAELLAMLPAWEIVREFDYNLLLRNREGRYGQ